MISQPKIAEIQCRDDQTRKCRKRDYSGASTPASAFRLGLDPGCREKPERHRRNVQETGPAAEWQERERHADHHGRRWSWPAVTPGDQYQQRNSDASGNDLVKLIAPEQVGSVAEIQEKDGIDGVARPRAGGQSKSKRGERGGDR
jgi:hypothetical protein